MTYSVYQHWDPLKTCVVGRSYPPEFYSWIKVPHVRSLFEKIAIETEEDYQAIIRTLEKFGVTVLRPELDEHDPESTHYLPPPMTPRDLMVMIGEKFYLHLDWIKFYQNIKDPAWPWYDSLQNFLDHAEHWQVQEAKDMHGLSDFGFFNDRKYANVIQNILDQGNHVQHTNQSQINGAMVSRIGRDLYFGTERYEQDQSQLVKEIKKHFPEYRNHIVNTGGHSDGTYCAVCPGLIVSLCDVPTYKDTFPGWEVVYLPGQSWSKVQPFLELKKKNAGRWWIPGFEQDDAVIQVVETWLSHWTGYVEETVFDVNMLIIDPKNVMVFNYNKQVFDAFDRYGITPHIVPFRHRYFWDGGIHCVTLDLDRAGHLQDFFPERG